MQVISKELDQDLAIMYEMSSTWNAAGRIEFLNKNKMSKYKETKERKTEFDRILHEWIHLRLLAKHEVEILKGIMEIHQAQRTQLDTRLHGNIQGLTL